MSPHNAITSHIPKNMRAWVIREARFGEPLQALQLETLPVPEIGDDEVLIYVMAAGVNYNGVWAALGKPVNVIEHRRKLVAKSGQCSEDFHIPGSDASGIVCRIGKQVTTVRVGDPVVVHGAYWDLNDPWIQAGKDPILAPSMKAGGYETNYGSFGQYARFQARGLVPKPPHLSWEEAAAYMVNGAAAYRMLYGFPGNEVCPQDVVLVWGGAGGLGSMAIQIAAAAGAKVVAVVSDSEKNEYCKRLGAVGVINRCDFNHWGNMPDQSDRAHDQHWHWQRQVELFRQRLWDSLGEARDPDIVIEHPGEATLPTSMALVKTGGMVVICAGTSGYGASMDIADVYRSQKRLQGCHGANDEQANALNHLVMAGQVDPCLSHTFSFNEVALAHQLMYENRHPYGNMAVLINAAKGEGRTKEKVRIA